MSATNTSSPQTKEVTDRLTGMISSALVHGDIAAARYLALYHWLGFITAVVLRLSFVANVWIFLFDHSAWVGMPLFFLLSVLFGGISKNPPQVIKKDTRKA